MARVSGFNLCDYQKYHRIGVRVVFTVTNGDRRLDVCDRHLLTACTALAGFDNDAATVTRFKMNPEAGDR